MTTLLRLLLFAGLSVALARAQEPESGRQQVTAPLIDELTSRFENLDYDGLLERMPERPAPPALLDFDPTEARYFDLIEHELQLSVQEVAIFRKQGFVSIDNQRGYSFTTAFHNIYTSDLPVLITTDSILYALHKSYEKILMELESTWFTITLQEVLADAHALLAERGASNHEGSLAPSHRDVDLYLTVARQLLSGAGTPEQAVYKQPNDPKRRIESQLGQSAQVDAILRRISSLKLENPDVDPPTMIYGGARYLDYSQFRPRGHYTKSRALQCYFRAMMWLSRADTGWNVLTVDPKTGLISDERRELANAVLLVELLRDSGGLERVRAVDRVINYMVGSSDSLNVFRLDEVMDDAKTTTVAQLADGKRLTSLQSAIRSADAATQMIRSQILLSDPYDPEIVEPPALFQVFGQRFAIDSYVLSRLVFDAIVFNDRKQKRMMPTGLDVMAAFGNDSALHLLEKELRGWNYSANMLASRTFVNQQPDAFWDENLYSLWLGSLRELDFDLASQAHAPRSMQTEAWRRKQLQTQLASWSQLRHNTVLYTKQSYTMVPGCEYLAGYVEPYPAFYAGIKGFARRAHDLIAATPFTCRDEGMNRSLANIRSKQLRFFTNMAARLEQLEILARKELNAEPFTSGEEEFLRHTISKFGSAPLGSSSALAFFGWYTELFYADQPGSNSFRGGHGGLSNFPAATTFPGSGNDAGLSMFFGGGGLRYGRDDMMYTPTITDVHTDPESGQVLQVGVGNVNLCVIAVDNEDDLTAFVGPVFSYHEFSHPASQRLTDEEWGKMLNAEEQPARPSWTESFAAEPAARGRYGTFSSASRRGPELVMNSWTVHDPELGTPAASPTRPGRPGERPRKPTVAVTDEGLANLAKYPTVRSLDLSNAPVTDEGLSALSTLGNLRNLSLSKTRIDGSGLTALRDAPWLRRLHLSHTGVSDQSVRHLATLPRLEILDLQASKVTPGVIVHLKEMGSLRDLDLRNTAVTGKAVAELQRALPKCRIRH